MAAVGAKAEGGIGRREVAEARELPSGLGGHGAPIIQDRGLGRRLTRQLQARLPNDAARDTLTRLREAFEVAEAAIPGMTSAFVLEIVENVEQVDENEL